MGEVQMKTGVRFAAPAASNGKRACPDAVAQLKPSHVLRGRVFLWQLTLRIAPLARGAPLDPEKTAQAAGPCLRAARSGLSRLASLSLSEYPVKQSNTARQAQHHDRQHNQAIKGFVAHLRLREL